METNSSGEELIIRTRKPYTITKQRERWTAEEHNKFVEALKLYGRAWQRIEEHIGTKTAVQIRSHAQKFFSKLEREASVKGLPAGEYHEIKIPPPRPKRKPSNPYPRKLEVSAPTAKDCPVSSTCPGKPVLTTESLMKGYTESEASPMGKHLKEGRAEILALFEEAPQVSLSESHIDNAIGETPSASSPSSFREFMPPKSDSKNPPAGRLDIQCGNVISLKIRNLVESDSSRLTIHSSGQLVRENEVDKSEKLGKTQMSENLNNVSMQSYPWHVPLHADMNITRSLEFQSPHATNNSSVTNGKEYPSNSSPPAFYPALPMLHPPFNPFQSNSEAVKSASTYITSTLSNFIMSNLAQNPATYAAANIAATFWSHTMDKDARPKEFLKETSNGLSYVDSPPNLESVYAATVAAASAWWASQGIFPFCHPYIRFPFPVTPTATATPVTDTFHSVSFDPKEERVTSLPEQVSQKMNETLCFVPESPPLSSDADVSACGGSKDSKPALTSHEQRKILASDIQEVPKMKTMKQHVRSSCGSNTTSSSEVETDMMESITGLDLVHPSGDLSNRRLRSAGNNNEAWKEVSEEGRLAFQALFSREVLPQSFSQKGSPENMEDTKSSNEAVKQGSTGMEGQQNLLIGNRLKSHRTGFKPYKRCSVEAKEMTVSRTSDKVLKRIRVEGDAGNTVVMIPAVSGCAGVTHHSS